MTEFIREKINVLNSLIQQFSLESYQNSLLLRDIEKSTGDPAVDQQMEALASNAKGVVLAMTRRIEVRKAELAELTQEFEASIQEPK
jgi:uncharacterized membrane protein